MFDRDILDKTTLGTIFDTCSVCKVATGTKPPNSVAIKPPQTDHTASPKRVVCSTPYGETLLVNIGSLPKMSNAIHAGGHETT